MGAFVAIHDRDGSPIRGLDDALQALSHRSGPPASWCASAIGLATRGGGLASGDGGRVVAADIRLDNRPELAAELGLHGQDELAQLDDAELILRAFGRWGVEAPTHLIGDFAFAVWDPTERFLYLARDPMGVRPLYYHLSDRRVACASESRALLGPGRTSRQLDPERVADYLAGIFEDRENTFYRGVRRLPAGEWMRIGVDGVRRERYWFPEQVESLRLGSDGDYGEAFSATFRRAVRDRLRTSGKVGSFLSGGLDSSSISCAAREMLCDAGRDPLDTYSAVFPQIPESERIKIDERPYMAAVTSLGHLKPHEIHADRLSPLTDHRRFLWHQDEAVPAANLYLHWAIYGQAQRDGVGVLLDGIDGDTAVSHGLEALAHWVGRGRWWRTWRECRLLARRSPRSDARARRVLWQHGVSPWLFPLLAAGGSGEPPWKRSGLLREDFARRIGYTDRARALLGENRPATDPRQAHAESVRSPLYQLLLEGTDKAAAAFGIETRFPFFDRRLLELCLSLPVEQKLRDGWTRYILRSATAGSMPDEIRWRAGKGNLAPNFRLRLHAVDLPLLREVVGPRARIVEDWVDLDAVRRRFRRWESTGDGSQALPLFSIAMLVLWMEQAFGEVREPVASD